MKGTSAPQTGDFKTGIGVGRAQVGDMSQVNQRMNDLTDRALDDKREDEKEKKALEDKFLESTDTSGMWQDEVPDILADINDLYEGTDMRLYTTDASYRAKKNQELNNIKSGVAFSVADKQKYQADLKLWKENPGKYEKPELKDYVQGSGRGGNYGAFGKTKDIVAKHDYGNRTLEETRKQFRLDRDKDIEANAGAIKSKTTSVEKVKEKTIQGFVSARQNDPLYRADYIDRMKVAGLEPDDSTPEGKSEINKYIDDQVRKLVASDQTQETETQKSVKETGGRGITEQQKLGSIYWSTERAWGGDQNTLSELVGVQVPGLEKGIVYDTFKSTPQGMQITYKRSKQVPIYNDDNKVIDYKTEFETVEKGETLNQAQFEGKIGQAYASLLGVKTNWDEISNYALPQYQRKPDTNESTRTISQTVYSPPKERGIVKDKSGKITSTNFLDQSKKLHNLAKQRDESWAYGDQYLLEEELDTLYGTVGEGSQDTFQWIGDWDLSDMSVDEVGGIRKYYHNGKVKTLDTDTDNSNSEFNKVMLEYPNMFRYTSEQEVNEVTYESPRTLNDLQSMLASGTYDGQAKLLSSDIAKTYRTKLIEQNAKQTKDGGVALITTENGKKYQTVLSNDNKLLRIAFGDK